MNPTESGNNSPENIVSQFETLLKKSIEALKERKENLSAKELKGFIRFFCIKNAQRLGVKEEDAVLLSHYFFRFLYDDPDCAKQTWELLHKLSKSSSDTEISEPIIREIFDLNSHGITPMWKVLDGIVRGNLSVESAEIADEQVFYMIPGENSKEGQSDSKRLKAGEMLEKTVIADIRKKPTSNIKEDNPLFQKILQYMEEDSESLIHCESWRSVVEKYFKGVAIYLTSTISLLNLHGKSDARKRRYKDFIVDVFQSHMRPLADYCREMAEDPTQRNPFAEDLLFEQYLLSKNAFVEGYKEPSYEILEEKWKKLFHELKMHIEDNATLYGIQAMDFLPELKQEAPKQETPRQDPKNKTIIGIPGAMPTEDWKPAQKPAPKQENPATADTIVAMISEEFARFSKTIPPQERQSNSSAMLAYPYIGVAPGTEAEKEMLMAIKKDVSDIFSANSEEIISKCYSKKFFEELMRIVKGRLTTHKLLTEFVSKVIICGQNKCKGLSDEQRNNVFDNMATIFDAMGHPHSIPEKITRELPKKSHKNLETTMPRSSDLICIKEKLQSIDSDEFENLKEFLSEKGLYERFKEIETEVIERILIRDTRTLGAFADLNTRMALAFSAEEGFTHYCNEKYDSIESSLKEIGKLTGNKFTKYFKFGRSKAVKMEMAKYLDQLKKVLNATWTEALEPTLDTYGKIIFGSDLYAQKS